jgi:hypothetical protein
MSVEEIPYLAALDGPKPAGELVGVRLRRALP